MEKLQYLLIIQYLGFRYHGFQKQKNAKTVQEMLDKTIKFILGDQKFKTFSSSRTDAMVSANKMSILLTTFGKIDHKNVFEELNKNLPSDIKAISLQEQNKKIDIIGDVKEKTYHYYFCHNQKMNPLAAPYFTNITAKLNIELMQEGAKLFEGEQNYKHFCYRGGDDKNYTRELKEIKLVKNEILIGSFLPSESYILIISGKGFLRHQIRLIMGGLINLGLNEITLEELQLSLKDDYEGKKVNFLAPASGLILEDLVLDN